MCRVRNRPPSAPLGGRISRIVSPPGFAFCFSRFMIRFFGCSTRGLVWYFTHSGLLLCILHRVFLLFGLFDLWFDMVVHPLWNIFSFFRVCLWNIFSAFPKRPSKYCYHDSRDLVAAGSQRCIEKGPPRPGPNALKHACMADWLAG